MSVSPINLLTVRTILSIRDLQAQGLSQEQVENALEIKHFNRVYVKSSTFSKAEFSKALSMCQKYLEANLSSFITELDKSVIVWQEQTNTQESSILEESTQKTYRGNHYQKGDTSNSPNTQKTSGIVYRGIKYN